MHDLRDDARVLPLGSKEIITMIETLRQKAKELLENRKVDLVIGYREGPNPGETFPVFISKPGEAEQLILNASCTNNL